MDLKGCGCDQMMQKAFSDLDFGPEAQYLHRYCTSRKKWLITACFSTSDSKVTLMNCNGAAFLFSFDCIELVYVYLDGQAIGFPLLPQIMIT